MFISAVVFTARGSVTGMESVASLELAMAKGNFVAIA